MAVNKLPCGTSSNHALAWHALYLAGVGIPNAGWGRLYQNTPPTEQLKTNVIS